MARKSIDRRDFLKAAAGVAAVTGLPGVVPSSVFGAGAPSERITLGFIACGKQSQHLMRAFLNQPGTQVVAACDVDKLKLERSSKGIVDKHYADRKDGSHKGCATYHDFRDVLARPDIDAVVISTPDHWHTAISIAACRAGKDIYCEKPLTQTIAEARALINAVRTYNRIFQVGSMQRSSWEFRFACELVRNGYIGDVTHVTVGVGGPPEDKPLPAEPVPDYLDWDMWVGPAMWRPYNNDLAPHISFDGFPNWRYHSYYGGGGMTDWGAHHFDIAQWGLGMDGSGPVEIIPPDGKDCKVLTYQYANGIPMTRDQANGVLFDGTTGKVEVNRGYLKTWPENLKDQVIGPNQVHLYNSKDHYADWLDAIRKRTDPICSIEIGASSVTVCHLGNIAYRLQRPLKWDPKREVFVGDDEANRLLSRPYRSPWCL
ncbi:MAG TPA: Gfo/Idh/MocA family oxidoreductase [Sedimentisphaerales bacterium]|jgi:predicted dehydrogenase|nr:Gfo/Idh/MocA family oxidoreductase [Sedimentisphaerales bacterium]HNU27617.1 Gfo/Idh/MocA family oxidoreductase [Sedimentisphaerales bacterium]